MHELLQALKAATDYMERVNPKHGRSTAVVNLRETIAKYEKGALVHFTKEEVEDVSSVLTYLTGKLQMKAVETRTGELDGSFEYWNNITKKVAGSFGYQAWAKMNEDVMAII
jgi:hypothetical protein